MTAKTFINKNLIIAQSLKLIIFEKLLQTYYRQVNTNINTNSIILLIFHESQVCLYLSNDTNLEKLSNLTINFLSIYHHSGLLNEPQSV